MAGLTDIAVPFAGTVLKVAIAPGDAVGAGSVLVVLESMKMEHVVEAESAGVIESVRVAVGDAVQSGDVLLSLRASEGTESTEVVRKNGPRRRVGSDPSWPSCGPGSGPRSTRGDRRRPSAGTPGGDGRPGRTSRTCATPAPSRSTAGWSSRPSGRVGAWRTCRPTRRPTG